MPSPGNTISSSHRGPAVDITIWSFFIVSGLAVATKVWTKLSRTSTQSARELSRLQLDDFTLTLALGFAAAFSITVSQQVVVGLGSPIDKIEPNLVAKYQKLAYSAQILYACALCTTNSGVILFGILLQPSPIHRNLLKATLILNAIWSLSSIFAIVFQCRLPHPWAIYTNKCIDQTAFWTYFEVIDIIVNLSLATILCSIIWILQMSRMKYLLIAFFSSRALLFIPIGFQFSHLHHIKSTPHWNITPDLATGAILSSAILNTNIFITCLPFLKPTMEYLQPGWSTSSTTTGFMRTGFGYSSMRSGSKSSRTENESEMMGQKT